MKGPNPFFILASFLVQVENIEEPTLEYTIEQFFTVVITIKQEEDSILEEEED